MEWGDGPPMFDDHALDFRTWCKEQLDDSWWSEAHEDFREYFVDYGLDCHDDACAMKLWEADHATTMHPWVRGLANACMTLEVFEWSMRDSWFDAGQLSMGLRPHPPLWRWDIYRNSSGGVRAVSGHLTWNGHPNHPSSSLGEQFKKYKN